MNAAFRVEDVRYAPERLRLRIDLDIAAHALPEDLAPFYQALARTGELRAAAMELGLSAHAASGLNRRLRSIFAEMGMRMYLGP